MGDRSPKANRKQAGQRQAKKDAAFQVKQQAIAAKQASGTKK